MIKNKKLNLEPRTAKFATDIIKFCRKTRQNPLQNILTKQPLRSATSIGTNYTKAHSTISH